MVGGWPPGHPARDTAWAMSQENVEIIVRGVEAVNRRDVDAFVADWICAECAQRLVDEAPAENGAELIDDVVRRRWLSHRYA